MKKKTRRAGLSCTIILHFTLSILHSLSASAESVKVADCERDASLDVWAAADVKFCRSVMDEVMSAGRRTGAMRRTFYQVARWIGRRRTVGDLTTLGYGAVVRILLKLAPVVRMRAPLPPSLRRDWEIFN